MLAGEMRRFPPLVHRGEGTPVMKAWAIEIRLLKIRLDLDIKIFQQMNYQVVL
jgi:hypothetical protein